MKATQCQLVRAWLKRYGTITPLEALRHLGVARLAARCYDLKQTGVSIGRELVHVKTKEGRARVARYYLA